MREIRKKKRKRNSIRDILLLTKLKTFKVKSVFYHIIRVNMIKLKC